MWKPTRPARHEGPLAATRRAAAVSTAATTGSVCSAFRCSTTAAWISSAAAENASSRSASDRRERRKMSREFIERFRTLHERARKGALTTAERPEYEQSRRELG